MGQSNVLHGTFNLSGSEVRFGLDTMFVLIRIMLLLAWAWLLLDLSDVIF